MVSNSANAGVRSAPATPVSSIQTFRRRLDEHEIDALGGFGVEPVVPQIFDQIVKIRELEQAEQRRERSLRMATPRKLPSNYRRLDEQINDVSLLP